MGCLDYFKEFSPDTKIYAVDAQGSVTFGHPPKPRFIPGIGTSRKPEVCKSEKVNRILLVEEQDAVKMCHTLLNDYGLFVGGSTGSVLHAVKEIGQELHSDDLVVAISPDFGEKYLDTIFNSHWLEQTFKNKELKNLTKKT